MRIEAIYRQIINRAKKIKRIYLFVFLIFILICFDVYVVFNYYQKDKMENVAGNKNFLVYYDPSEIMPLGGFYSGNDKSIFYKDKLIEEADPTSFIYLNDFHAKDKNKVYFEDRILEKAVPETFQTVGRFNFGKDQGNVYFKDRVIEGADPATFEIISDNYSKDESSVFFEDKKVRWADPKTFKITEDWSNFYRDKDNYFKDGELASKNDFLFLERGEKVAGVKNVGYRYNYYKGKIYYYDVSYQAISLYLEVKGADLKTFQALNNNYAKDKDNVYYSDKRIEKVDVGTFHLLKDNSKYDAEDIGYKYIGGEIAFDKKDDVNAWKIFANNEYKFELKYPGSMEEERLGAAADPEIKLASFHSEVLGYLDIGVRERKFDEDSLEGIYGKIEKDRITEESFNGIKMYEYNDGDAGCESLIINIPKDEFTIVLSFSGCDEGGISQHANIYRYYKRVLETFQFIQ